MSELIHKRRRDWAIVDGPLSLCGRYGYVHPYWAKVNCPACLKARR